VRRPGFWHAFAGLVLLALIARVVVVLVTPHFVPATDAADYDRLAVSLVAKGHFPGSVLVPGPTSLRPPLFPYALAAVYKAVGIGSATTRWEAGRLLEAALGAITVLLIGLIALRIFGRRTALIGAAIAAVYPPLVLVGSSLMSESLFIPLALGSVLAALSARASPRPWRWSVLSGLLLGLGALTRGNGLALIIPIAALVWIGRPLLSRRALAAPAALALTAALTLVPWTIRNASTFHEFVPITTETGYATAGTYSSAAAHFSEFPALWIPPWRAARQVLSRHPDLNEAQLSDRMNTLAWDYVTAHPSYVAKVFWWNSLRLLNLTGSHFESWQARFNAYPKWLATASVYAFWALGLLALGGALTAAARRAPLALWACPLVVFLSTVFLEGSTRYRSPADPFIVVLGALGVLGAVRVAEGSVRRIRPRRVRLPSAAA
jgi:4-amino-4-deoxy-L-arabinose transferase-like glycosyltransferase